MIKERAIIRESGTNVSGSDATDDFTSDAIAIGSFTGITLSFWAGSLLITGKDPTLTVQASNSTDVDSFVDVTGAAQLDITTSEGVALEDFGIEFEYVRFIYLSEGTTQGEIVYQLRKI